MANRPDGKAASTERVTFTRPAAERIASVVRKVEQGNRDCGPLTFDRVGEVAPFSLRVATFTGNWETGTYKTVTLSGSTATASVYNWVNPFTGGSSANSTESHYVIFGKAGGRNSAVELPIGGGGELRIGKVGADWDVSTCATVTIWEGDGTCEPTQTSPTETIEQVRNLSRDVKANSWVVIAKAADGKWYLVEAGDSDDTCKQTIGGQDITKWTGWNGSVVQLLGHDENGCLRWFDTNECQTQTGP